MSTLTEQLGDEPVGATAIHDALAAGVDVLSGDQTVQFVPYIRTVLPVDGYVFWLNAALLTPVQLAQHGLESADPITLAGSLHYASIGHMVEDETIAVRRVDLTSQEQITAFAEIAPDVMYVGTWSTSLGAFRFTFSQRSTFYQQASLFHYVGDAIYPAFAAQLIDDIDSFDQRQIVSNSLPLWLAMLQDIPFVSLVTPTVGKNNTMLQLYPAFLVPQNLNPPYAVIDIPPGSTRALAAQAWRNVDSSRMQLVTERARLSFYGLRNDEISDFLDYSIDYTLNTGAFGIMNMPVIQDDHRSQIELAALAQKKTIEYEISYLQSRARQIAQQYILGKVTPNGIVVQAPTPVYGSDHPVVIEPPPFIIGPLI